MKWIISLYQLIKDLSMPLKVCGASCEIKATKVKLEQALINDIVKMVILKVEKQESLIHDLAKRLRL